MRRKLTKALARSARRAVLLTTLSLLIALATGVGGFMLAEPPGRVLAAALPPGDAAGTLAPALPSAASRATAEDTAAHRAHTVPPVHEQPFEATRLEPPAATDAAPTPADDLVRAARAAAGAATTPALRAGDRVAVTVSFYYCEVGGRTPARGDGGGFCGAMRDGSVVYNGAAACDYAYLGQRFRIEGDPLGRVYRCADTGSAVHGLHRDVWFASSDDGWAWQRSVGQAGVIEILP